MSYLLENSLVVTKEEFKENENLYFDYDSYEIDNHFILTQNDKSFFSIYDIANYCKKKIKDDKLFLVVHKYYDKLNEEDITEFYIFNTIDIFEKSLTSFLIIKNNELLKKQKVIQDNIKLAQELTNQKNIHIILGDNIKLHEVLEYVAYPISDDDPIIFKDYEFEDKEVSNDINYLDNFKNYSLISKIINKVRIIEPKSTTLKRTAILIILILLSFTIAQDTTDNLFSDSIYEIKNDTTKLKRKLSKLQQDYSFKENIYNKNKSIFDKLNNKNIYNKSNK